MCMCVHTRPGWGVSLEGCIKSSDLPICLCCSSFLSPSIFNSLSTYFFSCAGTLQSIFSLCVSVSIFPPSGRDAEEEEKKKSETEA